MWSLNVKKRIVKNCPFQKYIHKCMLVFQIAMRLLCFKNSEGVQFACFLKDR